jgi:hypothetical protein
MPAAELITRAEAEARARNHAYVGTEHLLTPRARLVVELAERRSSSGDVTARDLVLACLEEGDGVAGQVLRLLGVRSPA